MHIQYTSHLTLHLSRFSCLSRLSCGVCLLLSTPLLFHIYTSMLFISTSNWYSECDSLFTCITCSCPSPPEVVSTTIL